MPAMISPVSDMLVTVKSRAVQRALFPETARDGKAARREMLTAPYSVAWSVSLLTSSAVQVSFLLTGRFQESEKEIAVWKIRIMTLGLIVAVAFASTRSSADEPKKAQARPENKLVGT